MCYSLEFHDSDILILNDLFWLILVPMSNIRIYHECNLVFFPMHFLLMTSSILTILKSIYMLIIPKYLSPVLVNNPILRLICNCLDISVRISNKHFKLNMLEIELFIYFTYPCAKSTSSPVISLRVNNYFFFLKNWVHSFILSFLSTFISNPSSSPVSTDF